MPAFVILNVYLLEETVKSCDHCGHSIKQCYEIVETETNRQMTVGSDCVVHLTSSSIDFENKVKITEKRFKRASAQWRSQKPPKKENETRVEYINRRLVEMDNALKAAKPWIAKFAKTSIHLMARDRLSDMGIYVADSRIWGITTHTLTYPYERLNSENGHVGSSYSCPACERVKVWNKAYDQLVREETEKIYQEHEQQYQANRFDFNQTIWNVRKI